MSLVQIPQHYYFVMKVGFGNVFLRYAKEWNGLWVGEPSKHDQSMLHFALQPEVRSMVRILTYSGDRLFVWKVTGNREVLPERVASLNMWREEATYARFGKTFLKHVESNGGFESESFKSMFNRWTLLPCELDFEIPRSRLVAPIDSLAVYRYLNSGTFRPVFTIAKDRRIAAVENFCPELLSMMPGKKIETEFGRFARYYFEQYARPLADNIDFRDRPLSVLSEEDVERLVVSILNPAQIETVATLLMLDFGITPDVGVGKGLDYVDVRGSFRHLPSERRTLTGEHVLKALAALGIRVSDRLAENVKKDYSLAVQCKAYKNASIEAGVLLLKPGGGSSNERLDSLAVEDLFHAVRGSNCFPQLRAWLDLLRFDLTGRRSEPKLRLAG
jgi:hypothetical protein